MLNETNQFIIFISIHLSQTALEPHEQMTVTEVPPPPGYALSGGLHHGKEPSIILICKNPLASSTGFPADQLKPILVWLQTFSFSLSVSEDSGTLLPYGYEIILSDHLLIPFKNNNLL